VKIIAQLASAPRVVSVGLAAAAVLLAACSQTPVTVTLHSLGPSGNLSFVCQGDDGDGQHVSGLKLDECPDYEHLDRRMLGLVTQTDTDEVAVVDLRAGAVLDIDPSTPGYTFLRVGARPGAIVSSPGGVASFVGVTGLQKNGVYALPTTCLKPPNAGEPARDVTTWAACSLTSAPGDIQVLLAGASSSCSAADAATSSALQAKRECPADLITDDGPLGRRKLLVALPEEHKLVLLDAQALLDRPSGEFQPCAVEATYQLQTSLPSGPLSPVLPDDLKPASTSACSPPTQYPPAASTDPTPAGMALSGSTLYVGDSTLPAVHVLDVSDPCSPKPAENDPLLPRSYVDPNRVVTTSRVAVSPLTPAGKQFVYAIDKDDAPASVMVFDVSAGVTNHAPLIFPGSPRQPFSVPDRLRFSAPARDVTFVMRDFPEPDPATGVGQFGLACDPTPTIDLTSAAALYRPNSDFTAGARPPNLRGVFGFVMLSNGQIPIIDVEDFDAPCRRPISANDTPLEDFRGCKSDPASVGYFTLATTALPAGTDPTGVPTVTNESSCNVIEQNRARAASLSISSSTVGLHAPTLRSLPQFSNPDPAGVLDPKDQPHMLAVDFANPDPAGAPFTAQVDVGAQLYAACPAPATTPPCDAAQPLQNDPVPPTGVPQNALTLPLIEPRSYVSDESPTLTFEGKIITDRNSGILSQHGDDWWIQDSDAIFCSAGVEDSQAIQVEGKGIGIAAANLPAWGDAHADYVQITGDFLLDTDSYWSQGQGKTCGNPAFTTASGRDACIAEFGGIDDPTALQNTRELSIVSAFSDHLVVKARNQSTVDDIHCCFPSGTAYTIRVSHQWYLSSASSFNDIAPVGPTGSCAHTADCDPRKKYFHARAFEVCDSTPQTLPDGTPAADDTPAADQCNPSAANVGCTRDFSVQVDDGTNTGTTILKSAGAIEPSGTGNAGSACIFENLTSRFVVTRGQKPSTRDMSFSWSTTGGFTPLSMSLAAQSFSVNPQAMTYIPELGFIGVVDGSSLGLSLFDLNSLGVVTPSPYF
jgi:hypothetical protein